MPAACLVQTGDVVADRLDFAVVQLGGDARHLQAVHAHAVTECGQLCLSILSILAGQTRVLRRNASTIRAVATGTGRDLAVVINQGVEKEKFAAA